MAGKIRACVLSLAAIVVLAAIALPPAGADTYPSRSITLIVPYTAGGGNDAMARAVADRMGQALGQAIVVENRGGAGGTLGTRQAARAAPDGYTLLIGGTGTLAIDPTLYPHVGYDPRQDFAPIGLIASGALVLVINPAVPVRSVAELVAYARQQPGKLSYASAGSGSGIHLAAVLFASMTGIEINHVPYRGSGPALTDLLGGHVEIYFSSLPPAIGNVRAGTLRALAVTAPKRSAILPELPTVAESGVPGYEAVLHYGIVAPAGTPRPIIDRLNRELNAALASSDVQTRLTSEGAEALPGSPEDYAADIDREERKWSRIVRESGATAE